MQTIKIKYHLNIDPIQQINGSDWCDLRAAETVEMKKGEFALISLGVSMKLPDGYEAHIVPRSSTYKHFGVIQADTDINRIATYYCIPDDNLFGIIQTNWPLGIIDNSYSGNNDIWKFPAYALRDTTINKNDRICQFRIVEKQPEIQFETVDKLDDEDRGGFGSTGRN